MKNSRQLARTAHDVRHLCICEGCKELADDRDTVTTFKVRLFKEFAWHPKCFHERYGDEAVLSLRPRDQAKFRLCDIPADLMKILVSK